MSIAPTDAATDVSTEATPGPITQHTRKRLGQKAYGIVFLVVAGAAPRSVDRVVPEALHARRHGHARDGPARAASCRSSSDVKLRGLIVGEVRTIEATPDGARLELALQPDEVAQIPANVTARLLPKTLFGERYVDLVTAGAGRRDRSGAGDVIPQDRSRVSIELETVFDDLLAAAAHGPAGQARRPPSTRCRRRLDGRGDQIGQQPRARRPLLQGAQPAACRRSRRTSPWLADTADLYAVAAPDFFRLTESLRVTNKTIVEKDQQLAAFLVGTAGFANEAAGFLRDNEQRIIQVGQVQQADAAAARRVLAASTPAWPPGLVNWLPRANAAFAGGTFHITLEVVPPRRPTSPGEEPRWDDKRGPHCYGLPTPGGTQANPFAGNHFDDGTQPASTAAAASPPCRRRCSGNASAADSGIAGTAEEQRVVGALLARDGHAADPARAASRPCSPAR